MFLLHQDDITYNFKPRNYLYVSKVEFCVSKKLFVHKTTTEHLGSVSRAWPYITDYKRTLTQPPQSPSKRSRYYLKY